MILRVFGLTFAAPLAVALWYGEPRDARWFVIAGSVTAIAGQGLVRMGHASEDLRRVEGLAVVALAWLLVAHAAAIPYVSAGLGPIDALFESMSGLTTTGATIMQDFSLFGRGMFFWRALTQWLGGMGVIALFVAVLPRLAIGGRQLFFAEAPGPTDDKLTPQIRKTAAALWAIYAGLTLAQVVALLFTGMPLYDSVCHAFTTHGPWLQHGGADDPLRPPPPRVEGHADGGDVDWTARGADRAGAAPPGGVADGAVGRKRGPGLSPGLMSASPTSLSVR